MQLIKKNIPLIVFNIIILTVYFLVISQTRYSFTADSFFYPPDSQQYLSASNEMWDWTVQGTSLYRPFLYPLLIQLFYSTGGVYFFWFFQFLCWVLSVNLIFFSLTRISRWKALPWIFGLLPAFNLSFIVFTMQALTEVFCIFLVSLMVFILVREGWKDRKSSGKILFILGLLTVTRPVFFYLFILYLIVHLYRFIAENKSYFKNSLRILLIVSPVIFQISMMKAKYGLLKVSDIDTFTLNEYLIAQSIHAGDSTVSFRECAEKAWLIEDKKQFMMDHFSLVFRLFVRNIDENLKGYPSLFYTPKYEHLAYAENMVKQNKFYYKLHLYFLVPVFLFLFLMMIRKNEKFLPYTFLYLICFYVVLTSGIAFSQGDRLLITLLPIWLILYAVILDFYLGIGLHWFLRFRKRQS